ncbi:hypothetical protein CDAR_22201 [Caerostris darwini]|uniref:Uncharacterized protein n=1 Tax=Caerostris darwini TaxID=1538125 RepID=A0AAV4USU9_9ARAC|nr:hypothetical protein CDAR_22201 [Caerostris darwini]
MFSRVISAKTKIETLGNNTVACRPTSTHHPLHSLYEGGGGRPSHPFPQTGSKDLAPTPTKGSWIITSASHSGLTPVFPGPGATQLFPVFLSRDIEEVNIVLLLLLLPSPPARIS